MTIESDAKVAQTVATGISSAGATLLTATLASKDTTTTLTGNTNAHQAIDLDSDTAQKIASAVNSFVNLIQSTASAFETIDKKLSQLLASGTKGNSPQNSSIGVCSVNG